MKVRNIIIISAVVAALWATMVFGTGETKADVNLPICDETEEARLKIALEECSAAVMQCAWGDVRKIEE